jgi:peptidoglycan/LPS O-acetylase OafA/YrhL
MAVVAYHVAPKGLAGGFVGVDIFFVISGFLISNLILRDIDVGNFSFARFYLARIRRIFPSLVLVMFASAVFGWLIMFPNELKALGRQLAAGATSLANFLFLSESGYFDVQSVLKPMLHLWSLGIEEQFYLFFPLLTFLIYRPGKANPSKASPSIVSPGKASPRKIYLAITAVLFIASLALNLAIGDQAARFYLPLTRMWELLTGVLIASAGRFCAPRLGISPQRPPDFITDAINKLLSSSPFKVRLTSSALEGLMSAAGLAAVILGIALSKPNQPYPSAACLSAVIGTGLILAAGAKAPVNRFFFSLRPLRYIGLISYPLYLWHWPMVSFAQIATFGSRLSDGVRIAIVLASLILAALTYQFVEKPIRFNQVRRRLKHLVLMISAAIIASIGFALALSKSPGALSNLAEYDPRVFEEFASAPATVDQQCLDYLGFRPQLNIFCRYTGSGGSRTAAILGDSHANSAFEGLADVNAQNSVNTLMLGLTATMRPILGLDEVIEQDRVEIWRKTTEAFYERILSDATIGPVFLIIRGADYIVDYPSFGKSTTATDEETYLKTLQASVDRLAGGGKTVFVVAEYPELPKDPRSYLPRPLNPATPPPLRDELLNGYDRYLQLLSRLKRCIVVRTDQYFCPGQNCLVSSNEGLPLYHDKQHLTKAGSRFQAERILAPYLEEFDWGDGPHDMAQQQGRKEN